MVRHQRYQTRRMQLFDSFQVPMFPPYLHDLCRYLLGFRMNQAVPGPADTLHLNFFAMNLFFAS